jgi:hypothetical protein
VEDQRPRMRALRNRIRNEVIFGLRSVVTF